MGGHVTDTKWAVSVRRLMIVGAPFYGAFLVLFAYVALSSRLLRPAADDYCLAVDSHLGVIGGTLYWLENLSGYFTSLMGAMALVGWPVLNLPWGAGSAVAFLVAALMVGLAGGVLLWASLDRTSKRKWLIALGSVPVIAVAWWSFLWFPQIHQADGLSRSMALILTHWQTNNGVYVFQTSWILIAFVILWYLKPQRPWAVSLFLPLGLAAGFAGAALVATVVTACVVALAYLLIVQPKSDRYSKRALSLMAAATAVSGLAAQMMPGSLARQQAIGSPPELSARWLAEFINAALPSGLLPWLQSLTHVGAAAILVFGMATGWWAKRVGAPLSSRKLMGLGFALIGVSLSASLSARITELFAYSAYWHFIPTWEITFLALWALGVGVGVRAAAVDYQWAPALALTGFALTLLVAVGSILDMTTSMAEREARWAAGGAPAIGGLADIEDPDGMVIGCWKNLALLRAVPERGLTDVDLENSVSKTWGGEGGSVDTD